MFQPTNEVEAEVEANIAYQNVDILRTAGLHARRKGRRMNRTVVIGLFGLLTLVLLMRLASGPSAPPLEPSEELGAESTEEAMRPARPRAHPGRTKTGLPRGVSAMFLHIHKGGGSSVCVVSRKNEVVSKGGNCNIAKGRLQYFTSVPERQRQFVDDAWNSRGTSFMANEWILPDRILIDRERIMYLTMLRNPVARTESHFNMAMFQAKKMRKKSTRRAECKWGPRLPSLDELKVVNVDLRIGSRVRVYFATNSPDNWQTRAVCGYSCAKLPFGKVERNHLEKAKSNLRTYFDGVGILEYFSYAIELYTELLKWPKEQLQSQQSQHRGTHHNSISFTTKLKEASAEIPELLDALKWFHAVNQLDIELYNFGLELFVEQLRKHNLQAPDVKPISSDFEMPSGQVITSAELLEILRSYVEERPCTTSCCGYFCAPIGFYWMGTARKAGLVPKIPPCDWRKKESGETVAEFDTSNLDEEDDVESRKEDGYTDDNDGTEKLL